VSDLYSAKVSEEITTFFN